MTANCSALGTIRTLHKSKCYLIKLWFTFIFGSNFIFLLFLGVVMYHNEFEAKENKPMDKPRIKLKHNIQSTSNELILAGKYDLFHILFVIQSTLALQTPCYNKYIKSSDAKSIPESFSSRPAMRPSKGVGHVTLLHSFMYQCRH